MSSKFKPLVLGVLAATAVAGFAAVHASATVSGHFVSEVEHTIVNQAAVPGPHKFNIKIGSSTIACDEASVQGTASTQTMTAVEGTMSLAKCHTEGEAAGSVTVHMNGCSGRGYSNSTGVGTGDLICPEGKTVVLTHPNCTATIPPKNNISGFTYTTAVDSNKHTITVDVNLQYSVQYHAGLCIFLGTNQTATVTGSTIVRATNTNGEPVGITAT